MGKKHKKESKKRKHHSRSRSKSFEKEEKKKHHKRKHKEKKKHCKKLRKETSSSYTSEDEIIDIRTPSPPPAPRISAAKEPSPGTPPPPASSSKDSLSIEETNALRAKLGLKPLQVDSKPAPPPPPPPTLSNEDSQAPPPPTDVIYIEGEEGHFVHKPAESLTSKKETEKLRAKLTERKEKREIEKKYKKVKTLGEDSGGEDSAAAWVSKTRVLEKEKALALKRAQELDEMDEVFGVSELIKEDIKNEKKMAYTSKNLKGLTVEHDIESFEEEKTVILTLKDKDVLDEDNSDTLINVNMIDNEKYKKNIFNKTQKPGYDYYDDEEQSMEFGEKTVLKKYDEEIEGEKKTKFTIGVQNSVPIKDKVKAKLRANMSLDSLNTTLQLASDYYTSEEMSKFKKPKKVRKLRKKALKADDILAMNRSDDHMKELGARKPKTEPDDLLDIDDTPTVGESLTEVKIKVEEPEEEAEFEHALNKARRLRNLTEKPLPSYLKIGEEVLKEVKMEVESEDEDVGGSIVLNSTAEFCRTLGDIPTYGLAGNREEADAENLMEVEKEKWANNFKREDDGEGGWQDAQMDSRLVEFGGVEAEPILDAEPDLGSGVAGALRMAVSKGYLEKETSARPNAARFTHLQAQNYSIEDKAHGEEEKFGRRDRYMGPTIDFKEKDCYKPNIKLEYIDDDGRILSAKEAFRYLSHKFHGKGPGKNKIEKRMKKNEQEVLMKQMSSSDTPLGTLQMLQHKQKETHSPYVVLSGTKQITAPTSISKAKLTK